MRRLKMKKELADKYKYPELTDAVKDQIDQRPRGAARRDRGHFHLAPEVVHVRLDGHGPDVRRQGERGGEAVARGPGRDAQVEIHQRDRQQRLGPGVGVEVERQGGLVGLLLTGGVVMNLHDDVGVLFQRHAHVGRQAARRHAGDPGAQVAGGDEPAEAAVDGIARLGVQVLAGVGGLAGAGLAPVVQEEDRVMHHAAVAGAELDGRDDPVLGDVRRDRSP